MKTASLNLTSSRLLMNECFLYLSFNRKGVGEREKMEGRQKRKRKEAIKKFLLSWTNGLFRRGSLPRLGDNRADTYYTTKLFSFFLHSFISFLIFHSFLSQTYTCEGNYTKKEIIDSSVPVLLFRPSVPPSPSFHPSLVP